MTKKRKPVVKLSGGDLATFAQPPAPAEGEPPRTPSFDVVAYTGGALELAGFDVPLVIALDGLSLRNNLIANLDHDSTRRVGHVTATSVEGGKLRVSGQASANTPSRDEVVSSSQTGFPWQASIEARILKMDRLAAGKTETVNGQRIEGPAIVARSAQLLGFAFVSHGADDATAVDIAATADDDGDKGDGTMRKEVLAWLKQVLPTVAAQAERGDLPQAEVASLEAQFDGRVGDIGGGGDGRFRNLSDALGDERREMERQEEIQRLAIAAIRETPRFGERIQRLAEAAVRDTTQTVQAFELALLREIRTPGHTVVSSGAGADPRISNRMVEAALAESGGLEDEVLVKQFGDQTLQAAHDEFRNGLHLQDLMAICARANGWSGTSVRSDMEACLRFAFGRQPNGMPLPHLAQASFSGLNLPNILSNTANKFLREGFMNVDQEWRAISSRRSANDFKTMTSHTLTGDFTFKELGPSGQIEHGMAGEEVYSNKVSTYARMFAITFEDIRNDDLGALTSVPRRLGRGAGLKVNNVFWTVFLNNSTFFTAARGNYDDGTDTVLDLDGLSRAEVYHANQTDPDGNVLGLMPRILLVPVSLKTAALVLMQSSTVITGADLTRGAANVFSGRYQVVATPYLENALYTGYSALAWYLLGSPMDLPVIEVAFLDGRDMPTVQSAEANFDQLGVQMRGYFHFGVALQEYRGGVKFKGEA